MIEVHKSSEDLSTYFLQTSVFLYVLAVFILGGVENLSRLVHVTLALVIISLLIKMGMGRLIIRREPLLIVVWLFLSFSFLSIYWSPDKSLALWRAVSLLFSIVGGTVIWISFWNGLEVKTVTFAAMIGGIVQATIAVQQFWSGNLIRADGLAGNANLLALQLILAGLLVLLSAKNKSLSASLFAITLLVIASIVTGSRKVIFAWVTYIMLAINYFSQRLKASAVYRGSFLIMLPLMLMALIYFDDVRNDLLLNPISEMRVYSRFEQLMAGEDRSSQTRLEMIFEAVSLWSQSPVWGHGIDQFRVLSSFGTYSHNNYVELLATLGFIGFFLYYSIFIAILIRAGIGLMANLQFSWFAFVASLLLLSWDVAMVSYSTRLTWIILALLGYLSYRK